MQEPENYKKEKLTINLVSANIIGVLFIIPIGLLFGLPYYLIWRPELDFKQLLSNVGTLGNGLWVLSFLGILILGVIVHELIHGITWSIFAKGGFKSMKFGILWKMLTPYCHCKEPLKVKQYIIGALMPGIILGIIPSIIAIIIGSPVLLLFGMVFTLAAAGDLMIVNLIRKENSSDLVQDHPSEAGCYIYRKSE